MLDICVMKNEDITSCQPDTEQAILRAAEQEFLTKGFAGARTASIAEAAGVTHAMFHYYFRTKQNLFERIMNEKIELIRRALFIPVADGDLSLEEMIRSIVWRHMDFLAANPYLPQFIISEVYGAPERSAALLERIRKYAPAVLAGLQEKIDRAADAGLCRRVDAAMLLLDIVSLNIFPFIAAPMVNAALGIDPYGDDGFMEARKKNNFETIMKKLRP